MGRLNGRAAVSRPWPSNRCVRIERRLRRVRYRPTISSLYHMSPAVARHWIQRACGRHLCDHGAPSSSLASGPLVPINLRRLTMGVAGPQAIPEAPAPQSQSASPQQQVAGSVGSQAIPVEPTPQANQGRPYQQCRDQR